MTTTAKVATSGRKPPAVRGNRKGVPNKNTREIKEMILTALSKAGGAEYLLSCAKNEKTKAAFLGLVGKVLPLQVTGDGGGPVNASLTITFRDVA